MAAKRQIIQLVPVSSPCWVFLNREQGLRKESIVLWALVEDSFGTRVVEGLTAHNIATGTFCRDDRDFDGYRDNIDGSIDEQKQAADAIHQALYGKS